MKHFTIYYLVALTVNLFNIDDGKTTQSEINMPFKEFFTIFGSDSLFQIANITFPLTYSTFDIEDNETQILILKKNWKFIDFTNDAKARNYKMNAFEVILKKDGNCMIYIKKGIDNGINVNYYFYFSVKKNIWTLKKIIDRSS